jgi:signal transduction histidine kinase
VAGSLVRPLRRLRAEALQVATTRLPETVRVLRESGDGAQVPEVPSIGVNTRDEIGEVARAFDEVHREAIRLAGDEAKLRTNVNSMFVNLSRRSQTLVERQLQLIEGLEQGEEDENRLANLFRLDHLATRMRRNSENLLVLAGQEAARKWSEPVPLVDIARASLSEVENYERVQIQIPSGIEIAGPAVTDAVHLLAELIENAISFSPRESKVQVTSAPADGGVMVTINDLGIGMSGDELAEANWRLANPPVVDVAVSRRMGLFVVGRLADRHGIRVQLRPSGEQAGTTSLVMLPDAITHGGGGQHQGSPEFSEFTVSTMIPQQPVFEKEPLRTAAELGFDDSRYEVPDDARELDPVGRSLMREERRAALEAQAQGQEPESDHPLFRDGTGQQQAQPHPSGYAEQSPYEGQQLGYDNQGQVAYGDQGQGLYDDRGQVGYDDQQQSGYDGFAPVQPSYDHGQQGAYEQEQAPQNGYAESPRDSYNAFAEPVRQADWQAQDGYQGDFRTPYSPETESAQATDAADRESVGFEPGATAGSGPVAGPSPSVTHDLTDAGLPRRGPSAPGRQEPAQDQPAEATTDDTSWRSANDERWGRAERLKQPTAGGVTPSGLPRRVPKANLVEGTAESTPQGGPQISRAPEDVWGRLSNLRRGVQRGRSEGSSDQQ